MKVTEFNLDKSNRSVLIRYQLTDKEIEEFDIRNHLKIEQLEQVVYDRDKVIRATFRAMDYPIEMMDYTFNRDKSGKTQKVVDVRQACMYQLRKHTDLSFAGIAKLFNFTHATAIHNINKFQDRLDIKDEIAQRINREVEYILNEVN